jgi:cystathionine gamma-lyase
MLTYHEKAQILARAGYEPRMGGGAVAPPVYQTAMFTLDFDSYNVAVDGADDDGAKSGTRPGAGDVLGGTRFGTGGTHSDASGVPGDIRPNASGIRAPISAHLPYRYTSEGSPNEDMAAVKLALVESAPDLDAKARLFPTGMAAIYAVALSLTTLGDHIIALDHCYEGTRRLFKTLPKQHGRSVSFTTGELSDIEAQLRPETRLIFLESPGSKLFELQDLAAISALGRDRNILCVIDNTWATPMFQNPLLHGFDVVVHSATKFLGGHNDLMGGVAIGAPEVMARLSRMYAAIDPHQSWLLNRSLATLPMRMLHHETSAALIAPFLEAHPQVIRVFWPGLPSHPQFELGQRQMYGCSGLMSFVTKGSYKDSLEVVRRLRLFVRAWSYGGPTSIVLHCGKSFKQALKQLGLPPNLIRIHVGFEDPAHLMEDLDQALSACG